MSNFRSIVLVVGILLTILASLMLFPLMVDLYFHKSSWHAFASSSFVTLFIGLGCILTCKGTKMRDISVKETFILTNITWITLVIFASLPIYFSELDISYTNAFFEAMSGLTTTGATVLTGLDTMPPSILVWRALLEWIGGIGIIVMAVAILPILRIGGMQLFRTESSDKSAKILPRARQISLAISMIYLFWTVICSIMLYSAGMTLFDAILHSLTTVSTGGFSTHDDSIAFFNSVLIERIIIFFTILAAIPFPVHIKILQGKFSAIYKDQQVLFLLLLLFTTVMAVTIHMVRTKAMFFDEAFRIVSFNVVSIITTSGFSSANYMEWGGFAVLIIYMLSVVGGCTGSTSGGIKIFRFQILFETAKYQIKKLIQPHGVFKIQYNHNTISEGVSNAVMGFFILFCFCFFIVSILLSLTGLDFISSVSGAAAALANIGPGLGNIFGPAGNYSPISDLAKWILSFAMLIGRLEIYTVFILFSGLFWRD